VLGHFPLAAQEELYGDRDHALWPFTFSGKGGTARQVEGGWIVSGQWGFCSGIDFSDWVGVSATIDKPDADDLQDRIALILPAADVEVIDNWHVAGMRGTGSRDIVVREAFVPAHRSISQLALQNCDSPGRQALPEMPGLAAPFYAVLLNAVLSTMLGMAGACIDDFIAFTRDRKGFRGIDHGNRSSTQALIGRAETEWDAAVTLARTMYDEIDRRCDEGGSFSVADRLRYRRNAVWIGERAVGIVNELVAAAGARAQHMGSAFQLIQRNMLTIRTHVVMDAAEAMEAYGRHRLAGDVQTIRY
jgi:3-hydroxy-9,10-secoandrosta-1,3,5(10)-triene-9,17-dione monooxygenase